MRLPPLPTIKDIIRLYNLRAKKHLSQNFLMDMNLTKKIARSASKKLQGAYVCEVGPGPGGITRCILEEGVEQLIVIEKDQRFIPGLELLNEASNGKMRIFHGDVLRFDMKDIFPDEISQPWEGPVPKSHIIGNLPFNVSTPLIAKWLENICNRDGAWQIGRTRLTLTFQKEIGERMVATITDKQRSRLSVMCQCYCEVRKKFEIPGKAFVPEPEVDVAVMHFVPRIEPLIKQPFKLVEKVVRHTFHYRQKFCKRGIQTLFPPDRPDFTQELFKIADVHPEIRPFRLSMEEFERLCYAYNLICTKNPGLIEYDYRSQENAAIWRKFKLPLGI